MSRETVVILRDDFDGSEAAETVPFAFRGKEYEIDLNQKNAAAFDKAMSKFVGNARQVGGRAASRSRGRSNQRGTVSRKQELTEIREWARSNDFEVSDRGRIPAAVVEAYEAR